MPSCIVKLVDIRFSDVMAMRIISLQQHLAAVPVCFQTAQNIFEAKQQNELITSCMTGKILSKERMMKSGTIEYALTLQNSKINRDLQL